jgi:hypothetical protein
MPRAAGNASIAARIAVIDYKGLNEKIVYPDVCLCAASAL